MKSAPRRILGKGVVGKQSDLSSAVLNGTVVNSAQVPKWSLQKSMDFAEPNESTLYALGSGMVDGGCTIGVNQVVN
jgi:hypothetical protein